MTSMADVVIAEMTRELAQLSSEELYFVRSSPVVSQAAIEMIKQIHLRREQVQERIERLLAPGRR